MRLLTAVERDRKLRNLVSRLRNQEPEAFADCCDLFGALLYVLIEGIVKKTTAADALLEECFLRAWNRAPQLGEDTKNVGSWLAGIARECAVDYTVFSERHDHGVKPPEAFPAGTMRAQLISSDRRLIEDGFRALSESEKRVIDLSFYQGLTPAAIAQQLRQPMADIEKLAKTGRTRLRRSLEPFLVKVIVK